MTVLVTGNKSYESYKEIAAEVMAYDHVHAEQVGFIEKPGNEKADARLQMAGDEFCGNACMSLAAFIAIEKELEGENELFLEVSGSECLIKCRVTKHEDQYCCEVNLPLPEKIKAETIVYEKEELEIVIVSYSGFLHIVVEVDQFNEKMKRKGQALARLLGLSSDRKLIGILFYNPQTKELLPLIYVPKLDSMVWERGCGSGAASIGACLAWKNKTRVAAAIKQPGGSIKTTANYENGRITSLSIKGSVELVAKGKAFVDITK
ncbi:diaminopimelate epimerase [Jeotgalibacillus proteolyticus]